MKFLVAEILSQKYMNMKLTQMLLQLELLLVLLLELLLLLLLLPLLHAFIMYLYGGREEPPL